MEPQIKSMSKDSSIRIEGVKTPKKMPSNPKFPQIKSVGSIPDQYIPPRILGNKAGVKNKIRSVDMKHYIGSGSTSVEDVSSTYSEMSKDTECSCDPTKVSYKIDCWSGPSRSGSWQSVVSQPRFEIEDGSVKSATKITDDLRWKTKMKRHMITSNIIMSTLLIAILALTLFLPFLVARIPKPETGLCETLLLTYKLKMTELRFEAVLDGGWIHYIGDPNQNAYVGNNVAHVGRFGYGIYVVRYEEKSAKKIKMYVLQKETDGSTSRDYVENPFLQCKRLLEMKINNYSVY